MIINSITCQHSIWYNQWIKALNKQFLNTNSYAWLGNELYYRKDTLRNGSWEDSERREKMFTLYSKGKARVKRNYTGLKRIEKVTW